MKPNTQEKRRPTRRIWVSILCLFLLAGSAAGYYYWSKLSPSPVQAQTSSYNTAQVRQGNITISASGSGTLLEGVNQELNFSSSGTVAGVHVKAGDVVIEGQVLAELVEIDELQAGVNTAQQNLISVEKAMQSLYESAAANLANAEIAVASTEKEVVNARSSLVQEGWARCDKDTTDAYYDQYLRALKSLEDLGDGGGNQDYYLTAIVPAKNKVQSAKSAYEYCAGYTQYEITSSHANLALAQAQFVSAKKILETLKNNNGIDPIDLATAQNKIENASLALRQAQQKLEGATLKAPFGGTILSVAGNVGDTVGTSTFITIADLAHPQVKFSVDETDLSKVVLGEQARVTFDAIPDIIFKGTVTWINPSLVSSNGYQVVEGLIELDMSQVTTPITILKGLNGSVELIQATAENVLLIPIQALHDLGDGTIGVFALNEDGQPRLKIVEVGLIDFTNAEIISGLQRGDLVTTGTIETP